MKRSRVRLLAAVAAVLMATTGLTACVGSDYYSASHVYGQPSVLIKSLATSQLNSVHQACKNAHPYGSCMGNILRLAPIRGQAWDLLAELYGFNGSRAWAAHEESLAKNWFAGSTTATRFAFYKLWWPDIYQTPSGLISFSMRTNAVYLWNFWAGNLCTPGTFV